jgi:predicted AAA+ superfamily ATPase
VRGGHPDIFLASSDDDAHELAVQLIRAFTEQDLPLLGLGAPPTRTRDLLRMVAHVHGHPLNMSTFAKSLGVSVTAIRKYLNFFAQARMALELPSYQPNLRKRLVKAPKLYITDSGLLHAVLGIESLHDLRGHPVLGNSWEGFVIQQVRAHLDERHTLHYFRTQDGSELDLIIVRGNRPMAALVITSTNAPKLSKGNTWPLRPWVLRVT